MSWWVWALLIAFPVVLAGGCAFAAYCDVQDAKARH